MTNKYFKFISVFVSLLASANLMTAFALDTDENNWNRIESSYYGDVISTRSLNDDLLLGSQIQPGTTTKLLEGVYDLNSTDGIDQFIEAVQKNGLSSTFKDNNTYFTMVSGVADPVASTAVIKNNEVVQVFTGDEGESYRINLDTNKKAMLAKSNINLSETSAKFILLDGLMFGIEFDDGTTQLIQPISSYKNILDSNKIYTIEELLEFVKENKSFLTMLEGVNNNLDPDKPDVVVG